MQSHRTRDLAPPEAAHHSRGAAEPRVGRSDWAAPARHAPVVTPESRNGRASAGPEMWGRWPNVDPDRIPSVKIAVAGPASVGKTTLCQAICSEDVLGDERGRSRRVAGSTHRHTRNQT